MPDHHPTHELNPPFRFCPLCGGKLNIKKIKPNEPDRLVCSRCSFIYYLDPKVAAGTVTLFEKEIVLVKRGISPGYGKWVIPGGFVDRGETPEEAAVRETLEETNLQVRITSLLNVYAYTGSTVIVVAYLADAMGGVPAACDESLEVDFFPFEKIPWSELAFPSTRDALKDYGKRFAPSS
ncbi:MAG: NUDIX hydrolase [Desulfobacca sp.]|nr:NUDIX hydrolase [Desulfobacca sp.]